MLWKSPHLCLLTAHRKDTLPPARAFTSSRRPPRALSRHVRRTNSKMLDWSLRAEKMKLCISKESLIFGSGLGRPRYDGLFPVFLMIPTSYSIGELQGTFVSLARSLVLVELRQVQFYASRTFMMIKFQSFRRCQNNNDAQIMFLIWIRTICQEELCQASYFVWTSHLSFSDWELEDSRQVAAVG